MEKKPVTAMSPENRDLQELPRRVVVFENPDHDFPQRLVYRRVDDRLIAGIEGEVAGESRFREWEWRLLD